MFLDSILHGPFQYKVVDFLANEAMGIAAVTQMQTLTDLTPEEKTRKECDIKAANMILHGLPNDIYTLLNHKKIAYCTWYMMKELMEDTELTKQEKESKLVDTFDIFTSEKGETIHSYYILFSKLMNDINIIGIDMTPLQVNTKFVIGVKQADELHKVSFDQLYAYLKQNEPDENETTDEQQDFLADGLEGFNSDCEELPNSTSILMTKKVDTYDLEVDDAPIAKAIFMAKLSLAGSINRDDDDPSYRKQTKVLESEKENQIVFTSTEKDLDSQMRKTEKAFNNEILTLKRELSVIVENNSSLKNNLEILKQEPNKREDKKAQRIQPVLYDGNTLAEKHASNSVIDFEETLILADESRLKIKTKQDEHNDKLIDYSKLNKLYEYFVPQKQISTEQAY
nr:hypothetical protein [Tanacetum cinerariifolium]